MESQPEPVTLSWEHINVFTKVKKKQVKSVSVDAENGTATPQVQTVKTKAKKQILHDVTGLVEPGTLLAVLGASGSGKSTMMNVLSDKNLRQYDVQGQVKVNGRAVGSGIRHISAYVQQDELFFTTLTVRETLRFRAMLRMDNSLTKEARLQRVDEVIQEMGLSKCANTQVGGTGAKRGISGGELKRLSFAAETLTNPALLFCDEPTSGLDSYMARRVVQALQFMASKNRTVICVIHQPSSEIFSMFDRLLLMAEGRLAFLGTADQAARFFTSMNYTCPPNYNPSDFYVLTLAIEPGQEDECREKVKSICEAFKSTSGAIENQQVINDVNGHSRVFEEAFSSESRYEASWGKQFITVLWRSWVSVFRNVYLFRVRAIQSVVFALLLGLVYLQQDYDQQGVQNINGALFLIVLNISFTSALSIVNSFPHELPVFLREYGTGLYRTDVYFLAKDLAELPSFVLLPFVYISILYWMIDLNNDWQSFLICAAIVILVANVAGSLGVMVSTLTGDVSVALSLIAPIMIPLILFGGFFLNSDTVPVYFVWLEHLSWFKYAMEIISVNQWDTIDTIACETNTTCFYSTGDDVLRYLGYSSDNTWVNVGVLIALLVGLRVLSFLCLLIRARRSKS